MPFTWEVDWTNKYYYEYTTNTRIATSSSYSELPQEFKDLLIYNAKQTGTEVLERATLANLKNMQDFFKNKGKEIGTDVGKIINQELLYSVWNNDTKQTEQQARDPKTLSGKSGNMEFEYVIEPIFTYTNDEFRSKEGGSSRKVGYTISPDPHGDITISVYRANLDSVFQLESKVPRDQTNMENDTLLFGSYVFYTEAGSSYCPHEGEERTLFYNAGTSVIGGGTLYAAKPEIAINTHEMTNVASDKPAVFRLTLMNNADMESAFQSSEFMHLSLAGGNPDGAKVFIDGVPIAAGYPLYLAAGKPVVKTMEVYRGQADDYNDLELQLSLDDCPRVFTSLKFSVHYLPESSPVQVAFPRDKWVMNTLSAHDSVGYHLPITIDGFDIHHKNFDHIEFQYKLSTENNDAWVTQCSFYADEDLYNRATGNKAKIENGRITPFRFYGERDPKELNYDLRAVSFCRYGSGFVTKESPVISGIKDTRPPVLFGKASPANGILTLENNISLRFSEPIAGNWLDEDNNFQILGVTNTTGITQTTSPYFDGEAGHFAYTKAKRELALTAAEIANTHLRRLTGYEYGLLDYYPMSESKGSEMSDLATGATLYAEGLSWTTPQGISLAADGEPVYLQPTFFSRNEAEDYSLLFWFRSFNNDDDSVSLFGTSIGDSTTMEIVLHEGELSYRAGEVYEAARAELNNGKWHHCALVISRTFNTGSLAIDGKKVLLFSALETGALTGTKMWLAKGLEGNIDDVCLFEQALPNELISEFGMQSPNGEEMGLINLLTFSKIKRNSANVMELVFSPENQRVFKDANGKVIEKEQILLVDDLNAKADKNNSAPVRDRGQLTRLPFSWNYQLSDLMINIKAQPREINKRTMYLTVRDVEDVNGNRLPAPVTWTVYADLNSVIWNERRHQVTLNDDEQTHRFTMLISNTTGMTRQFTIEHLPKWITASPGQGTLEAKEEKTVTFTINAAEITIGTHQQMIYLTDDQGLAEPLLLEITKESEPPYTNVDMNKYPFNMSLCGRVLLDESGKTVINTDEDDYVYAIFNNECVSVAHCTKTGDLYLTVHGNEAMTRKPVRFQLWKASTGKVYNLNVNRTILFAHGYVYGCGESEPVLLTAGESEMQTIGLNKGWNWISTCLDVKETLNAAITAEQPWTEGDLIKNPSTRQFCTYSEASSDFAGTLKTLDYRQMYMVYTATDNSMHIFGDQLPEDSMHVTLKGDGQWNALPCLLDQVTPLTEALTGYYDYASPGDLIKSHSRFATFSADKHWVGDLTALTPGEGYLFRRLAPGNREITFFRSSNNAPKRNALPSRESEVSFSNPAAATNMTMIAKVSYSESGLTVKRSYSDNGLAGVADQTLRVYVAGELACVASPMDSLYFLTIQSDKIGELRFEMDGETMVPEIGTINYSANAHHGTLKAPIVLRKTDLVGVYKVLENNHVVIIRNNEKYDVTGKKINK